MPRRQFKIPSLRKPVRSEAQAARRSAEGQRRQTLDREIHDESDTRRMLDSPLDSLERAESLRNRQPEQHTSTQESRQTRAVLCDLSGDEVAVVPSTVSDGIIILGRGANATIRLEDPYVHRVHSHLRWDAVDGVHIIAHGGGENGTYINTRKIRVPQKLHDGARIRVGRTEMVYHITRSSSPAQ